MRRACIKLDFVRPRWRFNARGAVLLALGITASAMALVDYEAMSQNREGLELRLADQHSVPRTRKPDKAAAQAAEEARKVLTELTTPWSGLLRDLELASAERRASVAVLSIEPDRDKRQVRLLAEAPTLPIALAYVERLQKSETLRYPMLESHELQAKDPQRPTRFQVRADWSLSQ